MILRGGIPLNPIVGKAKDMPKGIGVIFIVNSFQK